MSNGSPSASVASPEPNPGSTIPSAKRLPPLEPKPIAPATPPPLTDYNGAAPLGWIVVAPPASQDEATSFVQRHSAWYSRQLVAWGSLGGGLQSHGCWFVADPPAEWVRIPDDVEWPPGVLATRSDRAAYDPTAIGSILLWPMRSAGPPAPGADKPTWRTVDRWSGAEGPQAILSWLLALAPEARYAWTSNHGRLALRAQIPPKDFGAVLVATRDAQLQFTIDTNVDNCTGFLTVTGPGTAYATHEAVQRLTALNKGVSLIPAGRGHEGTRLMVYTTTELTQSDAFTYEAFGCRVKFIIGDPIAADGNVDKVIAEGFDDLCSSWAPTPEALSDFVSAHLPSPSAAQSNPGDATETAGDDAMPAATDRTDDVGPKTTTAGAPAAASPPDTPASIMRKGLTPFVRGLRPALRELVRRLREMNSAPEAQRAAVRAFIANSPWDSTEDGSKHAKCSADVIKGAPNLKRIEEVIGAAAQSPPEDKNGSIASLRANSTKSFVDAARTHVPVRAAVIEGFLKPAFRPNRANNVPTARGPVPSAKQPPTKSDAAKAAPKKR